MTANLTPLVKPNSVNITVVKKDGLIEPSYTTAPALTYQQQLSIPLEHLTDVDVINPSNNDVLAYSNGIWINSNSAGGAIAYSNAIAYVANQHYVNTSQLSANLNNYDLIGSANTAYSNAITQATIYANNAYINSIVFASNASNINTGTLSASRLPASGAVPNTYGSSSTIPVITIDSTGRITAVSTNSVAGVTSFGYTSANDTLSLTTGDGSSYFATINTFASIFVTNNITTNNLFVTDNMIYLNENNHVTSPDVGITAAYMDGTYHHTGLFRDHLSGTWKFFDNYLPEPDASIYIDQSNSTFHLANLQANTIFVGNNSVFATVNTTNYSGTANNTNFVGSISAANVVSNAQLFANLANYDPVGSAATAYSNVINLSYANTSQVVANASAAYTNAIAQANIYANNAYNNAIAYSGNAAQAYSNAVIYVTNKSYVNTNQLSSNLSNYQTTAGLSSNVATLTSNNTAFVGSITASNVVSNAQLQANLVNYSNSIQTASLASAAYSNAIAYSGNAAQAYSNAVAYVGSLSLVNTSQLSSNLANYDILGAAANAYANAISYISPITKLSIVGF